MRFALYCHASNDNQSTSEYVEIQDWGGGVVNLNLQGRPAALCFFFFLSEDALGGEFVDLVPNLYSAFQENGKETN